MQSSNSVAFVFVVQQGQLEIKACLLAASIRSVYGADVQLIAAVPEPASTWGEVSENALSLLESLKVDLRRVSNPFGKSYPIGNKLSALGVPHDKEVTAFLDSDMVLLSPADPSSFAGLDRHTVYAAAADKLIPGFADQTWETIYRVFDIPLPREKIRTAITNEATLPYFNAGLIAVHNNQAFSHKWLDTAIAIDRNSEIDSKFKRPWLDQISLPITTSLLGLKWSCLPSAWNYPGHAKTINGENVHFYHYHRPDRLMVERTVRRKLREIAYRREAFRRITEGDQLWNIVLHSANPVVRSAVYGYLASGRQLRKNRKRLRRAFQTVSGVTSTP